MGEKVKKKQNRPLQTFWNFICNKTITNNLSSQETYCYSRLSDKFNQFVGAVLNQVAFSIFKSKNLIPCNN